MPHDEVNLSEGYKKPSDETILMLPCIVVLNEIFEIAERDDITPFAVRLPLDIANETADKLIGSEKLLEMRDCWNWFVTGLDPVGLAELSGTGGLKPNGFSKLKMLFALDYIMERGKDSFGDFYYHARNYFKAEGTLGADYEFVTDFMTRLMISENDRVSIGLCNLLVDVVRGDVTLPLQGTTHQLLSVKRNGNEITMDAYQVLQCMQEIGVLDLTETGNDIGIKFATEAEWIKLALVRLLKKNNTRTALENSDDISSVQALG